MPDCGIISLTASPSHFRHASPTWSALPLTLSLGGVPFADNPNHVTFARNVQTRSATTRCLAAAMRCDIIAE